MIDVLLKTYLYCPRCAEDIESVIRKMKGIILHIYIYIAHLNLASVASMVKLSDKFLLFYRPLFPKFFHPRYWQKLLYSMKL